MVPIHPVLHRRDEHDARGTLSVVKLRLALVLAGAIIASVAPARAGSTAGAGCGGTAPIVSSCSTSFVASSSDLQERHFQPIGSMRIEIKSTSGSEIITCDVVPSLLTPSCSGARTGGFLPGQVITVRATVTGAGPWRVDVDTA